MRLRSWPLGTREKLPANAPVRVRDVPGWAGEPLLLSQAARLRADQLCERAVLLRKANPPEGGDAKPRDLTGQPGYLEAPLSVQREAGPERRATGSAQSRAPPSKERKFT